MVIPLRHLLSAMFLLVGAMSSRAADIDPYLPSDTEAVLTVNVRQILDAPLLKKDALAAVKKTMEERGGALKHLKDLDFDPQKDIDTLVLASAGGDSDRSLLIVHGRFEVAKFQAKAEELAKTQPKNWKVTTVPDGAGGQYTVLQSSQWFDFSDVRPRPTSKPTYIALLDKRVLVASPAKDLVIDALDKAKRDKKSALKSRELKNLLEKANGKQSIWVAAGPSVLSKLLPDDFESVKEDAQKIEAISGGITIEDDVRLELALAVKDADIAREVCGSINDLVNVGVTFTALTSRENKQWEAALDTLKSIKATTKGNAIIVRGAITPDVLEKALAKPRR